MSPSSIAYPGTTRVTYRLVMRSGAEAERFGLTLEVPRFGRGLRGEGSPIAPKSISLAGPARFGAWSDEHHLPACSPFANIFHGYELEPREYEVTLPRRSLSTLTAVYYTGATPPWPNLDYRLTFIASPRMPFGGRGTLERTYVVRPPRPSLRGRTGVRIAFSTSPRSSPTGGWRLRRIRSGRRVVIRGRTNPRIPGQFIRLAYLAPGRERLWTLARVRVNRRGHFAFRRWRPRRRGYYELWAFYRRQRRHLVSDHACPRAFRVVRSRRPSHSPFAGRN